jgi:hypothetical protein
MNKPTVWRVDLVRTIERPDGQNMTTQINTEVVEKTEYDKLFNAYSILKAAIQYQIGMDHEESSRAAVDLKYAEDMLSK